MEVTEIIPDSKNTPAKSFFLTLGSPLITVCVRIEALYGKIPKGAYFAPSPTPKFEDKKKNFALMIRAFPIDTFFSHEVQKELLNCQAHGCGVFFLVNEGNGAPIDKSIGNLNCGTTENIVKLRTLCIDLDGADLTVIKQKLKKIGITPHYVIQSSPGKYHLYMLIHPEEIFTTTVMAWKNVQRFFTLLIPNKNNKIDKSMDDLPQQLRVPGFLNLKPENNKFKVSIHESNPHLPRYKLKELADLVKGGVYHDTLGIDYMKTHVNGEIKEHEKYTYPVGYVGKGGRHKEIGRYMGHVIGNQVKLDSEWHVFTDLLDGHIHRIVEPKDRHLFLEGGERRKDEERQINDIIQKRRDGLFQYQEQSKKAEEDKAKPLPDYFYLNFPGDLGMITREIHDYVPYLSMEMCFAGALCISGMIKGDSLRFKDSWPYINGMLIAGPGSGKSTLKTIIEKTLYDGGFGGAYPKLIDFHNTVQSLHSAFYQAGGAATLIVDEAGDFLQNISSKYASPNEKRVKRYIKDVTTGTNQGRRQYPGGSINNKIPAAYGLMAVWMMIQPGVFERTLSSDDMDDGFLPRFFIFNGNTNLEISKDTSKAGEFIPSPDLVNLIASFNSLGSNVDTKALDERTAKEIKDSKVKLKAEDIYLRKIQAIYDARYEARCMSRVDVEIDGEAERLVEKYLKKQESNLTQVVKENGEMANEVPIYVRMKEMLYRLLCNASELKDRKARITKEIAEGCIKFQESQVARFFAQELCNMDQSRDDKEVDAFLRGLQKAHEKVKRPVTLREISHAIASKKRPFNIRKLATELVQSGMIWVHNRSHDKVANKIVKEYLPVESEDLV